MGERDWTIIFAFAFALLLNRFCSGYTDFPHLHKTLKPKAENYLQEESVLKLIQRILPRDVAHLFEIQGMSIV